MPLKMFPSLRHSGRASELDRAFHVKVAPITLSTPDDQCTPDDTKAQPEKLGKSLSPSERYDLKKFELKYRAFVGAMNDDGTDALVDDLYDDEVVHMMDGVPMNKTAFKRLHMELIKRGTKRTVKQFRAIDRNHVETVIHISGKDVDFCSQQWIALKDGKIIRVGKIHSVLPLPVKGKIAGAVAA